MAIGAIDRLNLWQDLAKQAEQSCSEVSFPTSSTAVVAFDCHPNLERTTLDGMISKMEEIVSSNVGADVHLNINVDLDANEDGYLERVKFKENDGRDLQPYAETLERIANALLMQIRVPAGSMGMKMDFRVN
jgi:hypothetical protein